MGAFERAPRMREYLIPEQLDIDGCISLCQRILADCAEAYIQARRAVARNPKDRLAQLQLQGRQNLYRSEYFRAISCGLVDGETVMQDLDRRAMYGE